MTLTFLRWISQTSKTLPEESPLATGPVTFTQASYPSAPSIRYESQGAESVAGMNPKLWDFGYKGIRYSLIPDIDACFQKTVVGTGTATYDAANGYFKLTTSATANDSVEAQRIIALPLATNTFDKNRHFRVAIMLPDITTNTVYVICGQLSGNNFFGFKIINGAVNGVCYKSGQSEQTVNLGFTMTNSTQTILEARLYSGNKIEFYINNFLYGTFTTTAQIPAGTTGANTLMDAKIQITAAERGPWQLDSGILSRNR